MQQQAEIQLVLLQEEESGSVSCLSASNVPGETHIKSGVLSHQSLNTDAHTFNNSQKDSAHDGAVSRGLVASSYGKSTTGEKPGNDRVVWVFLLSDTLDSAIKCAEQAAPYTKITSCYGRSSFDCCDHAYSSLSIRRVSESFDTVP